MVKDRKEVRGQPGRILQGSPRTQPRWEGVTRPVAQWSACDARACQVARGEESASRAGEAGGAGRAVVPGVAESDPAERLSAAQHHAQIKTFCWSRTEIPEKAQIHTKICH